MYGLLSMLPLLCVAVAAGGETPMAKFPATAPATTPTPEQVVKTVALGRPVAESPDFQWRRSMQDGQLMPGASFLQPHELQIRLPSGEVLRTGSRFTWVTQSEGNVIAVNIIPDGEPGTINHALDKIESLTREWGAALGTGTREVVERTRRLSGDARQGEGSFTVGGGSLAGNDPGMLFFTLRGSEGGWWPDVQVALSREEARRTAGLPAGATATRPIRQE